MNQRHGKKRTMGRRLRQLNHEHLEPRHLLAGDVGLAGGIGIVDPFAFDAVTLEQVTQRTHAEAHVPGDLIVATQVPSGRAAANSFLGHLDWVQLTGASEAHELKTLLTHQLDSGESVSLVRINIGEEADIVAAMEALDQVDHVLWSSPNFVYSGGDPRELIPNDPLFGDQYHHTLIGNVDAWDISLGDSNILIGITDNGVDLEHDDLAPAIWTNPGEVAGDGIDNDGNGYVDDVHGYNFVDNNNNPDISTADDSHGTHVAGISSAVINNAVGTVGTAPGTTIVPLKWFDGGFWTAAQVVETFTYAADNGIDIVNSSYNFDLWANDVTVHAAFDYMYDAGVLHFTSAGNEVRLDPPRQVFTETLIVASTNSQDTKAFTSNFGSGVDISAPGQSIQSTLPNSTYGLNSGTSMAAPNAAAAAALIWSANPTWTREMVVAQLLATADSLDAQNPGLVGMLGAGRINTHRGLTETLAAPQVESVTGLPQDGGVLTSPLSRFDVVFNQFMDPDSVMDATSYELREAGLDQVFDTADDDLVSLTLGDDYKVGTNSFRVDVSEGRLGFGEFRLTIQSNGLQNPFGAPLDGDGDGVGGDHFESFFTIEPSAPSAIDPVGSLVYEQVLPNTIDATNDSDAFALELDPGQSLTVVVEGDINMTPSVQVTDPNGLIVADVMSTSRVAVAQLVAVDTPGEYVVTVGNTSGSTGGYGVRVLLNSGVEVSSLGGLANNSMATAQNLESSALPLDASAERLAIVGRLPSGDGRPVDGEDFESGVLDSRWTTSSSTASGRIQVTGAFGTAGGSQALIMDVNAENVNNLNEAIWAVDLTTVDRPILAFHHAEWQDELDPLPATFNGSANGDGVSISGDGVTWHRVFVPDTQPVGIWVKQRIDLAAAAANAGIPLDSNFQIKFQQFDNLPLVTDGRGYDEITIGEPIEDADWFSFDLADGQVVTIAATAIADGDSLSMELYDAGGTLLASGFNSENVTSLISQFEDATSDGTESTYFVRMAGIDTRYNLLVTKDAEFDTGDNNDLASAQSLDSVVGVLGHVDSGFEAGIEPDDFVSGQILDSVLPTATLSSVRPDGTRGSVFAATASFVAPTGSLVLAPGPTSDDGFTVTSSLLRADFHRPTSFVSIDVGSDEFVDAAFMRAYSRNGELLEEVESDPLFSNNSATISITRSTPDIAYVLAGGEGLDGTPLDNLVFGSVEDLDNYTIAAEAGDQLDFTAVLPAGGPNIFENPLAGVDGSNLVLELLDPTGAVLATDSEFISQTAVSAGTYQLRVSADDSLGEYYIALGAPNFTDGDFNDDGIYDCNDVDALVSNIAAGTNDLSFDLDGNGLTDNADLDMWLAEAGAANLPSGNAYLRGDGNLDGFVDVSDFGVWNNNKFTTTAAWCSGDYNADGVVDVSDFGVWNNNKFTAAALVVTSRVVIPESKALGLVANLEVSEIVLSSPANEIRRFEYAELVTSGSSLKERGDRDRDVDDVFALDPLLPFRGDSWWA